VPQLGLTAVVRARDRNVINDGEKYLAWILILKDRLVRLNLLGFADCEQKQVLLNFKMLDYEKVVWIIGNAGMLPWCTRLSFGVW
jgi:hypothetical protein